MGTSHCSSYSLDLCRHACNNNKLNIVGGDNISQLFICEQLELLILDLFNDQITIDICLEIILTTMCLDDILEYTISSWSDCLQLQFCIITYKYDIMSVNSGKAAKVCVYCSNKPSKKAPIHVGATQKIKKKVK